MTQTCPFSKSNPFHNSLHSFIFSIPIFMFPRVHLVFT